MLILSLLLACSSTTPGEAPPTPTAWRVPTCPHTYAIQASQLKLASQGGVQVDLETTLEPREGGARVVAGQIRSRRVVSGVLLPEGDVIAPGLLAPVLLDAAMGEEDGPTKLWDAMDAALGLGALWPVLPQAGEGSWTLTQVNELAAVEVESRRGGAGLPAELVPEEDLPPLLREVSLRWGEAQEHEGAQAWPLEGTWTLTQVGQRGMARDETVEQGTGTWWVSPEGVLLEARLDMQRTQTITARLIQPKVIEHRGEVRARLVERCGEAALERVVAPESPGMAALRTWTRLPDAGAFAPALVEAHGAEALSEAASFLEAFTLDTLRSVEVEGSQVTAELGAADRTATVHLEEALITSISAPPLLSLSATDLSYEPPTSEAE